MSVYLIARNIWICFMLIDITPTMGEKVEYLISNSESRAVKRGVMEVPVVNSVREKRNADYRYGFSNDEIIRIVEAHNDARTNVGPTATDMVPVVSKPGPILTRSKITRYCMERCCDWRMCDNVVMKRFPCHWGLLSRITRSPRIRPQSATNAMFFSFSLALTICWTNSRVTTYHLITYQWFQTHWPHLS